MGLEPLPVAPRLFPDPCDAGPEGLVAAGGDLSVSTLLEAYRSGIFPWPMDGFPLAWFCPDPRAILEFDRLHVPRSLRKAGRRALEAGWTFSIDRDFAQVIETCARIPRAGQDGTWITPAIIRGYLDLHRAGHAHSVELRDPSGRLQAGMYGVEVDGTFAGESMFHFSDNGSKLVLLHLIERLASRGATWMDIQMLTPHLESLGAREVSRDRFLETLSRTRARLGQVRFFSEPNSAD